LIDRELDSLRSRPRPEVVHARLQTLLPTIEMHAHKGPTISSKVKDLLLTVVRNDHVLHLIIPQAEVDEFTEEPGADDLEFASENTAGVDVAVDSSTSTIIKL